MSRPDIHKRAMNTSLWSMAGNLLLGLIKAIAGLFGHSFALIADAIESLTDTLSSFLVYLGLRYSSKPADENHPYGHGRAESLITFVVVGFLILSAALIAFQSIHHIRTPHQAPASFTLLVLLGVMLFKEGLFRWVQKRGLETHSSSLKADAWHHRSDALTSAAAFLGISISVLSGGLYAAADDWAALFASGLILYNAYHIFRPALSEVMDEQVHQDMIDQIRLLSIQVEGVVDTEKCHIRKTGMSYLIDLHAMVDGGLAVREGHQIAHRLKDHLQHSIPQISDVLVHIEPIDH